MKNIDRKEAKDLLLLLKERGFLLLKLLKDIEDKRTLFLLLVITHPIFPALFFENEMVEKELRQKDLMSLELSHITDEEIEMIVWYFRSSYNLYYNITDYPDHYIPYDSDERYRKIDAFNFWKAVEKVIPQILLNFNFDNSPCDGDRKANLRKMLINEYREVPPKKVLSIRKSQYGDIRNALAGLWAIHVSNATFPIQKYLIKDGDSFINAYENSHYFYKNYKFKGFIL